MALQSSEAPPGQGWVTVGEVECRFMARRAGEGSSYAAAGVQYVPDMYVDAERSLGDGPEDHTHHFLPVAEHWLKKALNTWRDRGVLDALEDVATNPELSRTFPGIIASWSLSLWGKNGLGRVPGQDPAMSASEMVTEFSQVSHWDQSPVRAMALHPRLPYIALAQQDDKVEVRSLSQMEPGTVLQDKDQQMVTSVEWAPHCNSLLAVGAKIGVLLWNVDPSLPSSRFLTSWVRVESSPGHSPVSTISWSPRANFIISGSPADTNLIVWDVPMGLATRVRRTEGGGVNLVVVAPNGGRVFAASVGNVMRVWETETWTCEKWTQSTGRCKAACWAPGGDFLLFALHGDPALYYLGFHGNDTAGPGSAVKCTDLTPCVHIVDGQEIIVGGAVQGMAWDPSGERLAIIFDSDSPSPSLVAVFRTRITSMLEILPGGFIRGEEDDLPELVAFQQNCGHGALLATAWASGHVSFTPLLFSASPLSSPSPPYTHHQNSQLYSLH